MMRTDYYDPQTYNELPTELQAAVLKWIEIVLQPAKTVCRFNSYQLKHYFERSTPHTSGSLYLTDGQFKGAMLAAGYAPVDTGGQSWEFRVKSRSPFTRWSRKHISGYGYLFEKYCICHCSQDEREAYEHLVAEAKDVVLKGARCKA